MDGPVGTATPADGQTDDERAIRFLRLLLAERPGGQTCETVALPAAGQEFPGGSEMVDREGVWNPFVKLLSRHGSCQTRSLPVTTHNQHPTLTSRYTRQREIRLRGRKRDSSKAGLHSKIHYKLFAFNALLARSAIRRAMPPWAQCRFVTTTF